MRQVNGHSIVLGDVHHARLGPRQPGDPHVEGLDVERRVPERVAAEVAVEVVGHEHPVEGGVEADHHGTVPVGRDRVDPVGERLHGRLGVGSGCSQAVEREPPDAHRRVQHPLAVGLELGVEVVGCWGRESIDDARADREHCVVARARARRLDVDADEGDGAGVARVGHDTILALVEVSRRRCGSSQSPAAGCPPAQAR